MFDNRIFNVNGKDKDQLEKALALALAQHSTHKIHAVYGWKFDPSHGLTLYWGNSGGVNMFMTPLNAEAITPMIWEWLQTDVAKSMEFKGQDADIDFDGSTSLGWRVYIPNETGSYSICSIRPVYLWYGK